MKKIVISVGVLAAAFAVFFATKFGVDLLFADAESTVKVSKADPAAEDVMAERSKGADEAVGFESSDESETAEEDERESEETEGEESEKTPEEIAEEAEELAVEEFDALTDVWMEQTDKEVSMEDIDKFGAAFRNVPKARQDECVHRALNLIPDENVMLLAGILMDKSLDQEIIETVFNDVLNRDEEVKEPILQQIFKDKEHPCWADVAWILDVTGELPEKN